MVKMVKESNFILAPYLSVEELRLNPLTVFLFLFLFEANETDPLTDFQKEIIP